MLKINEIEIIISKKTHAEREKEWNSQRAENQRVTDCKASEAERKRTQRTQIQLDIPF